MNITIKIRCVDRNKRFTGELLEYKGYQFCAKKYKDDRVLIVELSTGVTVYEGYKDYISLKPPHTAIIPITIENAFEVVKSRLDKKPNAVKYWYDKFNDIPLNKRIEL